MDEKDIIEGVKNAVGEKLNESKAEQGKALEGVKSAMEGKYAEAEKIIAEAKKNFDDQVKQLNEDLQKKNKTIVEISEAIDDLKKRQGKYTANGGTSAKSAADMVNECVAENFDAISKFKKGEKLSWELKASNVTISLVTSTGSAVNAPYTYMPGFVTRPSRKVNIRDLVPVINSSTGTFIYYRQEPGNTGAGSFGFQGSQGTAKAALDYALKQVIVPTDYLAGTIRIAKQMFGDFQALQSFIGQQLMEDYRRAESNAFIPSLFASATSYTPSTATTVTAEKIVQAIGDLLGKDWDPNGIVTGADTWAKIMLTKPNDYNLPGGGSAITIDAAGVIRFLGMPVVVQNNVPAGLVIVGDFTQAAIIQAEGLSLGFYEQDQDNIVTNLITARLEARVGFTTMRTDAFDRFGAGTT